jgi:hypothetical protein
MTSILQTGVLRLATLATDGVTKTATYYLPPPSENGLTIDWEPKGYMAELVTGGELFRCTGWLPTITATWDIYDDVTGSYGYTVGSASGQQLDFESFMTIITSTAPGYLSISPGPTANGMTVNQVKVGSTGIKFNGINSSVKVTFRSGTIYQSARLGAF